LKPLVRQWPRAKIDSFIRCWHDGLEATALTERFGHRAGHVANVLRAAGYVLAPRGTNEILSRDKIKRPEDAQAAWTSARSRRSQSLKDLAQMKKKSRRRKAQA